jgi:imidazolonepropionase
MPALPKADLILENAREVITCEPRGSDPIGRIREGSVAVRDGRILSAGPQSLIAEEVDLSSARVIDVSGKVVAPGFVDCHTHLVFGMSRAQEYALRMTLSLDEVRARGLPVGIPASIQMTREASEDELFEAAAERLQHMLRGGTTTVESKSGYGINRLDELKILRVNQRLNQLGPIDIVSTFLGAHDFPPEIDRTDAGARNGYIETLIQNTIPEVAELGLAEFCDIYCDDGYYTAEEATRILKTGIQAGLKAKIHTEAYSNIGGARMAAELPAVSADHLNYATPEELSGLAQAGVVAVGLPALDFAVAHPKPFDARAIIESGATFALATNLNPGNWTETMHWVMVLACRRHQISPGEAMLAATLGGAKALCRESEIGSLVPGKLADIQIWDLPSLEDFIYRLDRNPVVGVIKRGVPVFLPCP